MKRKGKKGCSSSSSLAVVVQGRPLQKDVLRSEAKSSKISKDLRSTGKSKESFVTEENEINDSSARFPLNKNHNPISFPVFSTLKDDTLTTSTNSINDAKAKDKRPSSLPQRLDTRATLEPPGRRRRPRSIFEFVWKMPPKEAQFHPRRKFNEMKRTKNFQKFNEKLRERKLPPLLRKKFIRHLRIGAKREETMPIGGKKRDWLRDEKTRGRQQRRSTKGEKSLIFDPNQNKVWKNTSAISTFIHSCLRRQRGNHQGESYSKKPPNIVEGDGLGGIYSLGRNSTQKTLPRALKIMTEGSENICRNHRTIQAAKNKRKRSEEKHENASPKLVSATKEVQPLYEPRGFGLV